jgi:hypothetical protein
MPPRLPLLLLLLLLLLFPALGGCSISGFLPDWTSEDVAGPLPADYRFAIANRLMDIVGKPAGAGALEISSPRRVDSLKGASWIACIKVNQFPLLPRHYAVFFQRNQIVDSRLSVLVDQCEFQSYEPFDFAAEADKPPT